MTDTDWLNENIAAAREVVRELKAERDKAREECGHEKAMRKFISDERDRFIKNFMKARDEREALATKLSRVEALADEWERDEAYACTDASKCVRCVSFQRAVIRIRAALNEKSDQ